MRDEQDETQTVSPQGDGDSGPNTPQEPPTEAPAEEAGGEAGE